MIHTTHPPNSKPRHLGNHRVKIKPQIMDWYGFEGILGSHWVPYPAQSRDYSDALPKNPTNLYHDPAVCYHFSWARMKPSLLFLFFFFLILWKKRIFLIKICNKTNLWRMEGRLGAYETKLPEHSETLAFSWHVNQQMGSCVSQGKFQQGISTGRSVCRKCHWYRLTWGTCQIWKGSFLPSENFWLAQVTITNYENY